MVFNVNATPSIVEAKKERRAGSFYISYEQYEKNTHNVFNFLRDFLIFRMVWMETQDAFLISAFNKGFEPVKLGCLVPIYNVEPTSSGYLWPVSKADMSNHLNYFDSSIKELG